MAISAVTLLLEYVQKMLADRIDLVAGFKGDLRHLQNDLELMKAVLIESANIREKGEVYRQLERQIREVVYMAEDTIEDCLRLAEDKKSSILAKLKLKQHDLAKTVRTLREKEVLPVFLQVKMGFASLPMLQASAESSKTEDKKSSVLREENVVGFHEHAETLIRTLNEESKKLEVIPITGMAGIGKTTLAWKVYGDKRILDKFPIRIWVYESKQSNVTEVFLTILKKITTQNDMSAWREDQLAQEVRSLLREKEFLLVIDGVGTPDAWKEIEAALPMGNKSGKVLITSRYEKVASRAKTSSHPHKLDFLDSHKSWELLQLEIWRNLDTCPTDLKWLGKDIAKQCGGVPLQIVVIGGILAEKLTGGNVKNEWEKVSNSVTQYLSCDGETRTRNIIMMSYNTLPHDLKDCFLYLGMFPENSEIPAWKAIRLWMAEGFIQRRPGKSLEEVAQENLVDLIAKNLVMADKTNARGEVKSCRMHDMIREFCKSQAAFEKQNLFQEVKRSKDRDFDPPISEIRSYRRLCIHSYVVDFLRKKPVGPNVRSFLCFSKDVVVLPSDYISSIPVAFRRVRVLDMNPINFSNFPDKIIELIHLRYFAVSGEHFKDLPEPVSKLRNLQTIKIDTSSRTFNVKADIWKMMQLRHFKTKAAIIFSKDVKGKGGENLQTLSRLSVECCTEDVFNRAPNLKNLGIRGDLSTLMDTTCLTKLDHLVKLKLVYDVHPAVTSQNPLPALPFPHKFPPNLTILTLSSTYLGWKHMATLGQLLSLEVLKLKDFAFTGKHWKAVDGGFPCLEVLHIDCTDLQFWDAPGDPFPKLKYLQLKNCEELDDIPLSVREKNLEVLNIERASKSVVN